MMTGIVVLSRKGMLTSRSVTPAGGPPWALRAWALAALVTLRRVNTSMPAGRAGGLLCERIYSSQGSFVSYNCSKLGAIERNQMPTTVFKNCSYNDYRTFSKSG